MTDDQALLDLPEIILIMILKNVKKNYNERSRKRQNM